MTDLGLKLVRSHMERAGPPPPGTSREETRDTALIHALLVAKLHEETQEFAEARSRENQVAELGDILTVLQSLAAIHRISEGEVERVMLNKAVERGGLVLPLDASGERWSAIFLRRHP